MELVALDNKVVIPLEKEKYMCGICNKAYSAKYNVYDHMRKAHNVEPQAKGNVKCPLCGNFTHSYTILRAHLEETHQEKIEKEDLSFSSMEDFENWKHAIEDETNSRYVHPTGIKRLGSSNKCKIYYTCHRSGFFKSKSTGRKKVKLQGSCKIDATCPSTIEAVIDKATGTVGVTYWKNHVGHTTDIQHLTLTQEERAVLAEKMLQGASFEQILCEIRSTAGKSNVKRIHLIRKQDLRNIKRSWMSSVDSSDVYFKNESQSASSEDYTNDFDSADTKELPEISFASSDLKHKDLHNIKRSWMSSVDSSDVYFNESEDASSEDYTNDFDSADTKELPKISFASSDLKHKEDDGDNAWDGEPDELNQAEQEDEESDSDLSDAMTMHEKLELLVKMSSTIYDEDVTEVNCCLNWAIRTLQKVNPEAHEIFLAHKRRKYYESRCSDLGRRKWISDRHDSDTSEVDVLEIEDVQNVDHVGETNTNANHEDDN